MAQKVYSFLDAAGTDEMIDVMTDLGDEAFGSRIVTDLEQATSDEQMASAKLVYEEYRKMQATLDDVNQQVADIRADIPFFRRIVELTPYQLNRRHETVLGPIDSSVLDPREDTVYFQRDSLGSKYWNIYIWNPLSGKWYWMDTTEPYIDMFWHKDETPALLNAVGFINGPNWVIMPLERIRKSVENAFACFC